MSSAQRFSMEVRAISSIDEIARTSWNRLVPADNFYMTHAWLRSLERNLDIPVSYVVAGTPDGVARGALPIYHVVSPIPNRLQDPSALLAQVMGDGAVQRWLPSMLGGARVGYSTDVLVDPDLPQSQHDQVVDALLRAFQATVMESRARSGALLYLNRLGWRRTRAHLTGWVTAFALAEAWLRLPGGGFTGYMASLPASRRSIVRRDLRRFGESRCVITHAGLADWYRQAARLQVNVQRKYGHPASVAATERMFSGWATDVGESSVVFLCHRGTDLVGYSLGFRWGKTLFMRGAGMDYDKPLHNAEYFNVTYYAPIRYAAESGLEKIHLATESFDVKCLRGAELSPLRSAFWTADPASDELRRRCTEWNRRQAEEWDERYARLLHYRPSVRWDIAESGLTAG